MAVGTLFTHGIKSVSTEQEKRGPHCVSDARLIKYQVMELVLREAALKFFFSASLRVFSHPRPRVACFWPAANPNSAPSRPPSPRIHLQSGQPGECAALPRRHWCCSRIGLLEKESGPSASALACGTRWSWGPCQEVLRPAYGSARF